MDRIRISDPALIGDLVPRIYILHFWTTQIRARPNLYPAPKSSYTETLSLHKKGI